MMCIVSSRRTMRAAYRNDRTKVIVKKNIVVPNRTYQRDMHSPSSGMSKQDGRGVCQ